MFERGISRANKGRKEQLNANNNENKNLKTSTSTSSSNSGGAAASSFAASTSGVAASTTSNPHHRQLIRSNLFHSSASAFADVVVAVPQMGDSITEGAVASVDVAVGDVVSEDALIAQIETDKVTIDVRYTGKEPGKVTGVLVKAGDTVEVGTPVASVETGGVEAPAAKKADKKAEKAPEKADAPAAAAPTPPPKPAAPAPAAAAPPAPAASASAPGTTPRRPSERRVKITRLRARVAERLKGAQNTYAMLTTFNEIDMTGLMEMRQAHKDAFLEANGVKLGFMSAFVAAAADALRRVPAVNAVIDGDEIAYRDHTDISIAVATPKGLVVPVLRDVDGMTFAQIESGIAALGKKARDGTLAIDDMAGGTFTISNGGVYGSLLSTPIINPPQSAILGMHSINQRPMVLSNGEIKARPMMYVALTYDHRLIDGREAVTFLKRVKEVVEDPRRLLLGC